MIYYCLQRTQYHEGWDAYEQGRPLLYTATPEWQRGWREAKRFVGKVI